MGTVDLLLGFKGRINRGLYWRAILVQFIIVLVLSIIAKIVGPGPIRWAIIACIIGFYVWTRLASYCKRLHDMGSSGWGALFMFLPMSNLFLFIITACFDGMMGENKYGADPLNQTLPANYPLQVSIGNFLFSFKGRVNRAKWWLIIGIPILVAVLAGLLVGGIFVAQSMISTAKLQSFCRQANTEGKYVGDCKEYGLLDTMFNTANQKPGSNLSLADFCEQHKMEVKLSGSCEDFAQFREDYKTKYKINNPNLSGMEPKSGNMKTTMPWANPNDKVAASKQMKEMLKKGGGKVIIVMIVSLIMYIPIIWSIFAIYAKRLHDRNLSGWWQAIPMLIGLASSVANYNEVGFGGYGSGVVAVTLTIASVIGSIAMLVICGFLRGNVGANRFGADPLGNNSSQGVVI